MVTAGDPAPDFELPAAHAEGTVSLSRYRGRSAVLLALFRGFYCPFCRRQMAQLGATAEKLKPLGLKALGVIATSAERARLYYRYQPSRLPLGADPALATHRAYGLSVLPRNAETRQMVEAAAQEMARELQIPARPGEARQAIDRFDGFDSLEGDQADRERHQIQLTGQFLIDREGIVRWCSTEARDSYATFPSERQLLSLAARL